MEHELKRTVDSGQVAIRVDTLEVRDALATIAKVAEERKWHLMVWDRAAGLQLPPSLRAIEQQPAGMRSNELRPAIDMLNNAPVNEQDDSQIVLVVVNFHLALTPSKQEELTAALQHLAAEGSPKHQSFIALVPEAWTMPNDLAVLFSRIRHPLPDIKELGQILGDIKIEGGTATPSAEDRQRVLHAAKGLTRMQAEGAFSMSYTEFGRFDPDFIWKQKAEYLNQSKALSLHKGTESFTDLGGMEAGKDFCLKILQPLPRIANVQARGVLLLGCPGGGKSQFCKALGSATGRPLLHLDLGAAYGSLVGQTEEAIRSALRIADAMEPAVLMIDECEKALAGIGGSGDSGVATRLFGTLLTWLSDHTTDVFCCMTSNDVSKLPPEFTRAERLDGIFFLDLPDKAQRQKIWNIYFRVYQVPTGQHAAVGRDFQDEGWTGAEIKSCCRLSVLLDVSLSEAAKHIVPVSISSAEKIEELRRWASNRCLDMNNGGIYQHTAVPGGNHAEATGVRRRVRTRTEPSPS